MYREVFLKTHNYNQRAFLVNFVHDSVWIDCKRDVAKEIANAVAVQMSSMCSSIEKAFPGVQIPVDMHVTVSGGENMARMRPLLRTRSKPAAGPGLGVGQVVTEEVIGAFDELLSSTYTPEHPQVLVHPDTYTTGKMPASVAAALTQVGGATADLPSGAIKVPSKKVATSKKKDNGKTITTTKATPPTKKATKKEAAKAASAMKVKGPEGSKLRKDLKTMKARSAHSSISKELRELEGLSPK
eukprot:TRINITY_DN17176_c0_g1_i1.p1 TRINITY_DN17176_c0_g1~~TRINITY_DN17176_c0_g1_i1.p1  ORF type:complete len:242 (-),score=68.84 TRINITY_DN17176_c0_g1_i1:152-877(-)